MSVTEEQTRPKDSAVQRESGAVVLDASSEGGRRPYRWGYFQGGLLAFFSPITLGNVLYRATIPPNTFLKYDFVVATVGSILAIGMLWRKRWVVPVIYFAAILTAARFLNTFYETTVNAWRGDWALPEAIGLLIWICTAIYFHRRRLELS